MQSLSVSITSLNKAKYSIKNEKQNRTKSSILYFFALFYTFLLMGFGAGLIGPSLLKLSEQLNQPLDRTVFILTTRSVCFVLGTLSGGFLIDKCPSFGRSFLLITILIMTTTTAIIPFIHFIIPMAFVHGLWTFCAGMVDNLAQILTLRCFDKDKVNSFLQALHGAFGVGAFLSPLIIAPFLHHDMPVDQWHFAYWIIAGLHLPALVFMLFYAIRDEFLSKKTTENISEEQNPMNSNENENSSKDDRLNAKKIVILVGTTIFVCLYVGNETAFGSYLHPYASLYLKFPKDRAAFLNSLFWASFAVTRMFGILCSMKFSPSQIISVDLFISTFALTLIFVCHRSPIILWIGSTLYGIGAASVYASLIAYVDQQVSITGKRMSLIALGGSAGDALIPLLIGFLMNKPSYGPISFIIICLGTVFLSCFLFLFIVRFVKRKNQSEGS